MNNLYLLLFLFNSVISFVEQMEPSNQTNKMPAVFITHGGGPYPIIYPQDHKIMYQQLREIGNIYKPKAIIIFSAHWQEKQFTILDNDNPGLYYDYSGFPKETYSLKYQAKSSPQLRQYIKNYFNKNGINLKSIKKRGYDHGVFIPLMLTYPKADIPLIQISILSSLNPQQHFKIGQLVNELRNQGFMIIGSGSSFHSFHPDTSKTKADKYFDNQLTELCCKKRQTADQLQRIKNWKSMKSALIAHPREQHLIPLFITLGCSNGQAALKTTMTMFGNIIVSNFIWL